MNNNIGLTSASTSGSGSLISSLVTSINQIPSELLSDRSLFDRVLGDNDLWSMVGDFKKREILDKFLPDSLDSHEKEETIRLLFNGQLSQFDDNPLDFIYFQLKLQRTSPDLLRTYEEVNRLKRRAYIIQEQKHQCKLLTEVLSKRRILFEAALNSSATTTTTSTSSYGINLVTYQKAKTKFAPENGDLSVHKRRKLLLRSNKVKERYKLEIKRLFPDEELNTSEDEINQEPDLKPLRSKASLGDSISKTEPQSKAHCDISSISDEYLTIMKKIRRKRKALQNGDKDDPVMDFSNITLGDIISRVTTDSEDDLCERSFIVNDLKSSSPFTLKGPKVLFNSSVSSKKRLKPSSSSSSSSTITSITHPASFSSAGASSSSSSLPSSSTSSSVLVNETLLPSSSSTPLLSRQLSQTSTSCQTSSLSSSQFILNNNNSENLLSPKKSQSTTSTAILNTNSIKREPIDIFDFDNDSSPHSFPLPPLSLAASTTSNPAPPTPFSAIGSQPNSPHLGTSLSNIGSTPAPGLIEVSPSPVTYPTPIEISKLTSSLIEPMIISTIPPVIEGISTPPIKTTYVQPKTQLQPLQQQQQQPQSIQQIVHLQVPVSSVPQDQQSIQSSSETQPAIQIPTQAANQTSLQSSQSQQQSTAAPDLSILPSPISINENPPGSFFSLIRDIFYANSSTDRKLTLHRLEELVKEKLRTLDLKVNWSYEMVSSAMNYLSGIFPPPEMIPLVDYKEKNQLWQWIGINRDTDDILVPLCNDWLEEKDKKKTTGLMDPSQPIPPAICQTNWTVRSSTEEEKKNYRDQEAARYKKPHKAFTFTIHGYTSVVGPVKGCGIGGTSPHAASPNKAREHSLLTKDRPPFVTLLSLVRDAAARLPNGEGTRADICELLKDSQYLLPTVSDQQVNGIVSGALDRLHYEKDPCVKYDVNRKVWIYLHRNRSEEEFERLHEVQVAAAKAKRILHKTQRKIGSSSSSLSSITQTPSISTTIGNFSKTNVTTLSGKPQPSAKANKSALGSSTKPGESQFETNTSTILTSIPLQPPPPPSTPNSQPQVQPQILQPQLQAQPQAQAQSLPPVPKTPTLPQHQQQLQPQPTPVPSSLLTTSSSSLPSLTTSVSTTTLISTTTISTQTLTSKPTFSLVSSNNQQPISLISSKVPVKAAITMSSPSTNSTNFSSIIPSLSLANSSTSISPSSSTTSGITLNVTSISTLVTASSITSSPTVTTATTATLPNINLSSSSLQRLSIASPAHKKKTHRPKTNKKDSDSTETLVPSNLGKQLSYSSGTMTIAPMSTSSQTLPGFEKIVPSQTNLVTNNVEPFTSLIAGGDKAPQVKQIRPAKTVNSTIKVTPIVSTAVTNVTNVKTLDNVQHFLSLTTKATASLPSNITITSSATKPIAPKLGSGQTETQQIIFPSAPGQTIYGKSILNPFEPKQSVTQTIQSSSQQQTASNVQHQILKPILPAPIQTVQSQSQQQLQQLAQQTDKQPITKLNAAKPSTIQPQPLTQQIITLQPASIAVTSQSQHFTISKTMQTQQTSKPHQIQIHNAPIFTASQISAEGKQTTKLHAAQLTLPKHFQLQGGTTTSLGTPTQFSIPTSVLFGARPGSVVLAAGGKSYMMATSGGSIVLHPQVSGTNTMQTSTNAVGSSTGVTNATTSLAVRTLQGIRVIPVTAGIPVQRATTSSSLLGPNSSSQNPGVVSPHHVVARIITTASANQSPHGSATQAQIVLPSTSAIQPILLASPQQLPNRTE